MSTSASKYYTDLARGIDSADIDMWEVQITAAETMRITDRAVMDIIGAHQEVPEPAADVPRPTMHRGRVFHWLQLAIELEEQQWVLELLLVHLLLMGPQIPQD
jgi:hypothetical protein